MNDIRFSAADRETLERIMQLRRDVRGNRFCRDDITAEDLDLILQAATWAPSVGFSQPWEFVLVRDRAVREKIAASFADENRRAAGQFVDAKREQYVQLKLEGILETPLNIAVFYKPSQQPVLGQTSMTETGEYSVVCAVQNMWLMARAINIGIGWVSILDPSTVKAALNAPADHKLVAYLCVGHVRDFPEQPELETLGWEARRALPSVVWSDRYPDAKT
ncbi:MAG TPA: 5,6-dimethylbenzimidazole synthase [Dongiaceae bacterium]|nr:5,6-dimethylbenzimidazole synthase [Dongiaceae bacterium]